VSFLFVSPLLDGRPAIKSATDRLKSLSTEFREGLGISAEYHLFHHLMSAWLGSLIPLIQQIPRFARR
jgi:hypothetical protein